MGEKLGEIFVDGDIVSLDESSMETLEKALNKVRQQRIDKIKEIAKLVDVLQA